MVKRLMRIGEDLRKPFVLSFKDDAGDLIMEEKLPNEFWLSAYWKKHLIKAAGEEISEQEFSDLGKQAKTLLEEKGAVPKEELEQFTQEQLDLAESILKGEHVNEAGEKTRPLKFVLDTISTEHVGDDKQKLVLFLGGLTPNIIGRQGSQLHEYPAARSGKGKSSLCSKVLLCFPKGTYHVITSLSGKALYYASKYMDFDGKVVFVDEAEHSEDATGVLLALTADGIIDPEHWTVVDGEFVPLKITGSRSIWLNSITPIKDNALLNRFLILTTDESANQDEAVNAHQKQTYGRGLSKDSFHPNFKISRAMVHLLQQNKKAVLIPFIDVIDLPDKENRRNFPLLVHLIEASAFFHQFQRPSFAGRVVATFEDLEIAAALWVSLGVQQSAKITKNAELIFNKMKEATAAAAKDDSILNKRFDRAEVAKMAEVSVTEAILKLDGELSPRGVVNSEKEGNRWVYWLNPFAHLQKPIIQANLAELDAESFFKATLTKLREREGIHIPESERVCVYPPSREKLCELQSGEAAASFWLFGEAETYIQVRLGQSGEIEHKTPELEQKPEETAPIVAEPTEKGNKLEVAFKDVK